MLLKQGIPGNPGNPAPTTAGQGGDGVQVLIGGPHTYQQIGALDPGPGEYQWFGGGGGGSQSPNFPEIGGTAGHGGKGGGGTGRQESQDSTRGQVNTGGGGGGGIETQPQPARRGGSGIVVLRYQIAQSEISTAKATGGAITSMVQRPFMFLLLVENYKIPQVAILIVKCMP